MTETVLASHRYLARNWDRLNGFDRIQGIDFARGLAVIGMFAAHLLWIEPFSWSDPGSWVAVAQGRSSILFATIAGLSIGLISGGRQPVRGAELSAVRSRLAVRALALLLIGLLLVQLALPVYVILPAYAILFWLSLPFLGLSASTLLYLALATAIAMPVLQVWLDALPWWSTATGVTVATAIGWNYPFPVWIAFVLAGLGVARLGVRELTTQVGMVGIGSMVAATAYLLDAAGTPPGTSSFFAELWTAEPHSTGVLESVGSGAFAIAVIGLCLLACRTFVTWLVLPLRAVGAMPLTAYVAQLLSWGIVAALQLQETGDLGGFRDLEPFWPMAVLTVVGCTAWSLLIGRGPLEQVIDWISRPPRA